MKDLLKYLSKFIPDKVYLRIYYAFKMKKILHFNNPKTFNEKLQWLKIYDRQPIYTTMVDKYEVKKYVSKIIGEKYIIPTLGIYNNFKEIDFDKLPNQFVIKCTHDSGNVIICHDKANFDYQKAEKAVTKSLKKNYFYASREWPYKNVKRKIIIEKYMCDESQKEELIDYKLMCFNGKVKCSFVCTGRNSKKGLAVDFYDREWQHMPFKRAHRNAVWFLKKPNNYDLMIELAEILAQGIPFVRVDFYEINNSVYFGEMTFYPGGGLESFTPNEYDRMLGDWLNLDRVDNNEK